MTKEGQSSIKEKVLRKLSEKDIQVSGGKVISTIPITKLINESIDLAISLTRKELIEKIEKLKVENARKRVTDEDDYTDEGKGYKQALVDLLKALKKRG